MLAQEPKDGKQWRRAASAAFPESTANKHKEALRLKMAAVKLESRALSVTGTNSSQRGLQSIRRVLVEAPGHAWSLPALPSLQAMGASAGEMEDKL